MKQHLKNCWEKVLGLINVDLGWLRSAYVVAMNSDGDLQCISASLLTVQSSQHVRRPSVGGCSSDLRWLLLRSASDAVHFGRHYKRSCSPIWPQRTSLVRPRMRRLGRVATSPC